MERPLPHHKGVYILPNLFTTASLFAGFWGVLMAAQGNFEGCAIAILFSALMDGLDGKVARLTNTASEFGVQYDSLADLVAFGLTPAFMVHQYQLHTFHKAGVAVAFLFTVCAALRLARFNVTTAVLSKRFFVGLPTPAAGCCLALTVLFVPNIPQGIMGAFPIFCLLFTCLLAVLMVSNIRYASFKELGFIKAKPFKTMVGVIILFALVVSDPIFYGYLTMLGYITSGLIYTYIIFPRMAKMENRLNTTGQPEKKVHPAPDDTYTQQ